MNKGIQRGSEESESLQPAKRTPEEEEEDGGRGIGREGKGSRQLLQMLMRQLLVNLSLSLLWERGWIPRLEHIRGS